MEFWIDVGGTFTDSFGRRPDGVLLRHKGLSSGVTKGAAGAGSNAARIVDPARSGDPMRFWIGYGFRLLDTDGQVVAESKVADFDRTTGAFSLSPPLAESPRERQAYELFSGE